MENEMTVQEIHYIKAIITEVNNLKLKTLEEKIKIYAELLDEKFPLEKSTYIFTNTIRKIEKKKGVNKNDKRN